MEEVLQGNGTRMTWKDMDITYMQTGFSTVGSSREIKRKGMESISGQMEDSIKDGGTGESSMALVSILTRTVVVRNTGFGRWANGLGGLKRTKWLKLTKERILVSLKCLQNKLVKMVFQGVQLSGEWMTLKPS